MSPERLYISQCLASRLIKLEKLGKISASRRIPRNIIQIQSSSDDERIQNLSSNSKDNNMAEAPPVAPPSRVANTARRGRSGPVGRIGAPLLVDLCPPLRGRGRGRAVSQRGGTSAFQVIASPGRASPTVGSPAGAAARYSMNQSFHNGSTFECIVCLENLDSPATIIDEVAVPDPVAAGYDPQQIVLPVVVGEDGRMRVTSARGRGAGRGRGRAILSQTDPQEVVTTTCGHMYHKYCIEKWFHEQGRKSCPSCRKTVTGKLIRLYPNMTDDGRGQARPRGHENNPVPGPVAVVQNLQPAAATGAAGVNNVNLGLGGGTLPGPRVMPPNGCMNQDCIYITTVHQTLVTDYNNLREQFASARDDIDVLNAQNASLQEGYDAAQGQINELRTQLADNGSKRRRER